MITTTTLRRGKATTVAFMLTHTVVLDYDGRKLACTREDAQGVFDGNKKVKMVEVRDGESVHYEFSDGPGRTYKMYSQRL